MTDEGARDHDAGVDEFERQLVDRLRARAERTRVDLDRVGGGTAARGARDRRRSLDTRGRFVSVASAAVVVLAVGGLLALTATRDPGDDVPGVTSSPTPPSDATMPVPSTDPPSPTFGLVDESARPTLDDHWHVAYGFSLCGEWFTLSGNLEQTDESGRLTDDAYARTGIHSHDDGVIHIHPFTSQAEGDDATLGLFLSNYGIELDDDGFRAPADQLVDVRCGTEGKELVVVVWPDAANPTDKLIVTEGLAGTPLRDGSAIAIALTDDADAVPPPPWASALSELGAIDNPQPVVDDVRASVPPTAPPT